MYTTLAVDVTGPIEDALVSVARFVPSFLLFVLILLVGLLLATVLRTATDKILERVGFDRLVERGGVGRALSRSRYDASDLVARLVYYAVLLFTLQVAFGVWGPNPVSDLIDGVVAWLPKAIVAIVIVVVAAAIANAARDLVGGALGGLSYGRLLANLAYVFVLGLGIIAALDQIGVATAITTPVLIAVLATIAGILIVGVGGGLVRPMQQRWDSWLGRLEQEAPEVSQRLRAAAEERRQAQAEAEARRQAEAEAEALAAAEAAEAAEREEAARRVAVEEQALEPALDDDLTAPIGYRPPTATLADAPTMVVPPIRNVPPQAQSPVAPSSALPAASSAPSSAPPATSEPSPVSSAPPAPTPPASTPPASTPPASTPPASSATEAAATEAAAPESGAVPRQIDRDDEPTRTDKPVPDDNTVVIQAPPSAGSER